MIQTTQKKLTLADFLQLPETTPASEYINGQIFQKPMPQGKHSKLQGGLVTFINSHLETNKLGLAFPELRCNFGGRSLVPDVTIFSWNRIPVDENGEVENAFNTYPDWTIEILSPEQNQTKVTGNILHCLQNGTSLGWLIDPAEKNILVFPSQQQPLLIEDPEALLPILEKGVKITLTLKDIFGWLKL